MPPGCLLGGTTMQPCLDEVIKTATDILKGEFHATLDTALHDLTGKVAHLCFLVAQDPDHGIV